MKTEANPDGIPIEVFDGLRAAFRPTAHSSGRNLPSQFFGTNREGAKVSEGVLDSFWLQCTLTGFPGSYLGIKAFSETDFNEDLKKFDVPTFIMHGEDDQIVPVAISALRTAKIVKDATLKVYPGFPHGMCQTQKDVINADLLEFIQQPQQSSANV